MNQGKLVFSQLMAFLPLSTFRRCVAKHRGDHKVQEFTCMDQFLTMAFAQLTYRESLRDIEVNLRAQAKRLYHMGLRCKTVSRNTLANANATRPWQIYADFAQHLIAMARPLYAKEPMAIDLDATVYAFDATTIDLCLSVYPWAPFRAHKAAIKLHTLLDLRGSIPTFIHISDGKTHEVNTLDLLDIEPGAYYLLDRGYLDFQRLFVIHQANAFFVTRAKTNLQFTRHYSKPVDRLTGLRSDHVGKPMRQGLHIVHNALVGIGARQRLGPRPHGERSALNRRKVGQRGRSEPRKIAVDIHHIPPDPMHTHPRENL